MYNYELYFDVTTNTNVAADFNPALSIDTVSRITDNINTLIEVLGITSMTETPQLKIYKSTVYNTPDQVNEGEVVALTKVKRTLAKTVDVTLKKYRRLTTAEAIAKKGADHAMNEADERLAGQVRKEIRNAFFANLAEGTGTATSGGTLQATLANVWGKLQELYQDTDTNMVFFINSGDLATYLGSASITTQEAFGFKYIADFLGLGTAIVSPSVTSGYVYGTASENLVGAYVSASGDLGQAFGLTSDATGLVGMTHTVNAERASVESLIMSGVAFAAEDLAGIVKVSIVADEDDE